MTTRNGSLRTAALALVASAGLATAAGAQWRVTGFGGVYAPTADVLSEAVTVNGTTAKISMKHKTGFIVGLNANRWFADHAGFEGTFAYINSDASANVASGTDFAFSGSDHSYLLLGAAKLLYGITPHQSAQHIYLSAGPAIIGAGGNAYKDQEGLKLDRSTTVGGVIGAAARLHLNDLLCFKLGADDYMYNAKIKLNDTQGNTTVADFGSKFQNDLVFSAGLSLLTPW